MSRSFECNSKNPNWANQLKEFQQFKNAFPRFVGGIAVNFFKDSFRRQGWLDRNSIKKWEPPTRREQKKGKKKNRAILVQTGRLRRSIRVIRQGLGYVTVGSDVPYAQIHNEGGTIHTSEHIHAYYRKAHTRVVKIKRRRKKQNVKGAVVKSHTRMVNMSIPQRQFMGVSNFLERRILMQAEQRIQRILNIK